MAIIVGTAGKDSLVGGAGDDELLGLGNRDTLLGGAGNDTLDGGAGADSLEGGVGDDLYVVDSLQDVIGKELKGNDSVAATFSIVLSNAFALFAANQSAGRIENVVLLGGAATSATGNGLDNVLTGNAANNLLNGAAGSDTMIGGLGDDRYVVDRLGDLVVELAGQGRDRIQLAAGYLDALAILPDNVEDYLAGGLLTVTAQGNGLANRMTDSLASGQLLGLEGHDTLLGRAGDDTLDGGAGHDSLSGGDGGDLLLGGLGKDTLAGGNGDDRIAAAAGDSVSGGAGFDLYVAGGTGATLDLLQLAGSSGMEGVDLRGLGANKARLDADTVLSGTGGSLRVLGDAGDSLDAGAGWRLGGIVTLGNESFARYLQGGATLLVDLEVGRSGVGLAEPAVQPLSGLGGTGGFVAKGASPDDRAGTSVALLGDVNGDGFADFAIGAPGGDGKSGNEGEVFVVFGAADTAALGTAGLDLGGLDGSDGFRLVGRSANGAAGYSLAAAGDVNGDGFADILVGADRSSTGTFQAGEAFVVFGAADFSALGTAGLALGSLNGTQGFALVGGTASARAGFNVAAGDLDGDGYSDLIVAAPFQGNGGGASVVYGSGSWSGLGTGGLSLGGLDGSNGFFAFSPTAGDFAGIGVAAGDLNGDGVDDLVVGIPGRSADNAGGVAVVFGGERTAAATFDLSKLDGTNGFFVSGAKAFDEAGRSVAVGDVNGDGIADLIVGAPYADPNGSSSGAAYLLFGKADWSGLGTGAFDLGSLNGSTGVKLSGVAAGDKGAWSVSHAGDFNGDGIGDLIIGAPLGDGGQADSGGAYLVYGREDWSALGKAGLSLAALDGGNGRFLGGLATGDDAGLAVRGGGDLNGDGFDDGIVGAPDAGGTGQGYVVYGGPGLALIDRPGSSGNDTITGSAAAERLIGGTGNDYVISGGGADVFRGGAGHDVIVLSQADFASIDGGTGLDQLSIATELAITAEVARRIESIELLSMGGGGAEHLALDLQSVTILRASIDWTFDSALPGALYVLGGGGDTLALAGMIQVGSHGNFGLYGAEPGGEALLAVQNGVDVTLL